MNDREFDAWFNIIDSKPMIGFIEVDETVVGWYDPLVFNDKLYLSVHFDEDGAYLSIYDRDEEVLSSLDAELYLKGKQYDFGRREFVCSPE